MIHQSKRLDSTTNRHNDCVPYRLEYDKMSDCPTPRDIAPRYRTYCDDDFGDYSVEPVKFHWLAGTSRDEAALYAEQAHLLTAVARESREYRKYDVETPQKTVAYAHDLEHRCPASWLCPMSAYECSEYDWS